MATDTLNVVGAISSWPARWSAAYESALSADYSPLENKTFANMVIAGVGAGAAAGNLVAAVFGDQFEIPCNVLSRYRAPKFIGPETLVLAMSHSGDDEETVSVAAMAAEAGASVVAMCAGGEIEEISRKYDGVFIRCLPEPLPGAALADMVAPLLAAVGNLGLLSESVEQSDAVCKQLGARFSECNAQIDLAHNPAKELARKIGRTIPLLYGGGAIGGAAAACWKRNINRNAKAPAFASSYPEIDHAEVCGFGQHGDVTRQILTLVELRHDYEHERIGKRFDVTREIVSEALANVLEFRAGGTTRFAQAMDLAYVGAWTSLYMAYDAGVDPGPIPAIDELKAALGH